MELVALLGFDEPHERVIRSVLAVAYARGLQYDVAVGGEQVKRAGIALINGADPAAVGSWQQLRAVRPDVSGILVVDREPSVEVPAERKIRAPLRALALMGALGELDILRRPNAARRQPTAAPVASAKAPAAAQTPPVAKDRRKPNQRARVLVVDDSATVRSQLEIMLTDLGLQVETADSGEAALYLLTQSDFDAVLLDVVLPGVDGYQTCKMISRGKSRPPPPVILLTSKSSPFDRVRGSLAGCASYLTKPVKMSSVADTLARHMRHEPAKR